MSFENNQSSGGPDYRVRVGVFESDVDEVYKLALDYRAMHDKKGLVGSILRATKGRLVARKLASLTHELVSGDFAMADHEREVGLLESYFPDERVDIVVGDALDGELEVQKGSIPW